MKKESSSKKDDKLMTAEEFDRHFDDGGEILSMVDWSSVRRPGLEQRRVNVDFPHWMIASLDAQAARMGVTRQSVIKVWIAERLQQEREASRAKQTLSVAEKPPTP